MAKRGVPDFTPPMSGVNQVEARCIKLSLLRSIEQGRVSNCILETAIQRACYVEFTDRSQTQTLSSFVRLVGERDFRVRLDKPSIRLLFIFENLYHYLQFAHLKYLHDCIRGITTVTDRCRIRLKISRWPKKLKVFILNLRKVSDVTVIR